MNRRTFMAVAVLASMIGAGVAWAAAQAKVGEAAPDFTLQDQNGKEISLSNYKGKIVVLEWFNPGCPVTQRHHSTATPTMKTTASKYADNDVVWLAINSHAGNTVDGNRAAATKYEVGSPILADPSGKVGRAYGAKSTPHMFIIGKDGKLAYAGAIDDDPNGDKGAAATNYVAKAIDELLAGKAVSTAQTRSYGCGIKYAD